MDSSTQASSGSSTPFTLTDSSSSVAEAAAAGKTYGCKFCNVTGFVEPCHLWDQDISEMPEIFATKHMLDCPRRDPTLYGGEADDDDRKDDE